MSEDIKNFIESIMQTRVIASIVVIVLSIVIYRVIVSFLNKNESKNKLFSSNKGKTYIKLIRSVIKYIFVVLTVMILLQVNGIEIGSVIAGVGIFGAIFGLAMQDWFKDIIRGASILSDNYFSVGDIVNYKGTEGKVIVIGLKTTKIEDLKTGNIKSIANRNIDEIDVVSKYIYINIPMPYELPVEKAEKIVFDIVSIVEKNDNVNACKYLGVNELADSSINYLVSIECNPLKKLQARRDALRVVLTEMEKNGISVPYTQIDIHEK